jgi:hypothetical protein
MESDGIVNFPRKDSCGHEIRSLGGFPGATPRE